MWGIIRYLRGISRLQILGASPQTAINRLAKQKIGFWDLEVSDPFTYNLCVLQKDCERAIDTIKKAQCDCSVVKKRGLMHDFGGLLKRPGIWAALVAAVMIPPFSAALSGPLMSVAIRAYRQSRSYSS